MNRGTRASQIDGALDVAQRFGVRQSALRVIAGRVDPKITHGRHDDGEVAGGAVRGVEQTAHDGARLGDVAIANERHVDAVALTKRAGHILEDGTEALGEEDV